MTAYCDHCGQTIVAHWTKKRIIAAILADTEAKGRPPTAKEWLRGTPAHPANAQVIRIFGSWNKALEAAGLPTRPFQAQPSHWTRETAIAACRTHYLATGRPPQQRDWKDGSNPNRPTPSIVTRLFGPRNGWSKMIRAARLHEVWIPSTLPSAPVAEIVKAHLVHESREQIATRAGVTERTLYAILSGERPTMRKDIADRLLVAIDRPDAWHVELAEWAA